MVDEVVLWAQLDPYRQTASATDRSSPLQDQQTRKVKISDLLNDQEPKVITDAPTALRPVRPSNSDKSIAGALEEPHTKGKAFSKSEDLARKTLQAPKRSYYCHIPFCPRTKSPYGRADHLARHLSSEHPSHSAHPHTRSYDRDNGIFCVTYLLL